MADVEAPQELPLFMQQDFSEESVRKEYVKYMTDLLSHKIVEKSNEWGIKVRGVQSVHQSDSLVIATATVTSLGLFGRTKKTAKISIGYAAADAIVKGDKAHWSGHASFEEKRSVYVPAPPLQTLVPWTVVSAWKLGDYLGASRSRRVNGHLVTGDVENFEQFLPILDREIFSPRLGKHLGATLE